MAENSTPSRAFAWVLAVASGLLLLAAESRWHPTLPAQARSLALLALAAAGGYALARLLDHARAASRGGNRATDAAQPLAARDGSAMDPKFALLISRARFALETRRLPQDPPHGTVCRTCGTVSASHRYALDHSQECRVGPLAELLCQIDPSVRTVPDWVAKARSASATSQEQPPAA